MNFSLPLYPGLFLYLLAGCGVVPGLAADKDRVEVCAGYPEISAYLLPWDTARKGTVLEGNCGKDQNKGHRKYAYKFGLALGTTVIAARAGTITAMDFSHTSPTSTGANFVEITHVDGTVARYLHLASDDSMARVGTYVTQGTAIAKSGDSGVRDVPALSFTVLNQDQGYLQSTPISFSNSGSTTSPLSEDMDYPLAEKGAP